MFLEFSFLKKWKLSSATLVCIWLVFTVSLSFWWIVFSLRLVDTLMSMAGEPYNQALRHLDGKRIMLLMEGSVLVISLLVGGVSLLFLIRKEKKRQNSTQKFFATFTHELKTSLTSLRLQGESLQEELLESQSEVLAERLVRDTVRLELQLENSLFLAQLDKAPLFFEKVRLSQLLGSFKYQWPMLQIRLQGDAVLDVDMRALNSVLKNIIQNSLIHGKASEINVTVSQKDIDKIDVSLTDNGQGFSGDRNRLGELFSRQSSSSGSGIGLYLVKTLMDKMLGEAQWVNNEEGSFITVLQFRGDFLDSGSHGVLV